MNVKPTLLVTALAAAALLTVGCEQRGTDTSKTTGQAAPAPTATAKIEAKTSQAADKVAMVADDTAITAKVKAAILAEPGLKSLQINVDTKDATVTLSGNVDSDMLRDRAKQIAMSTEGVKNVVDNLSVKTG
jgi:osmotically-inducible protein OsmY